MLGASDTVRLQAAGATTRPARVRTARCSLHWCRGGSSRLHPVIPGSAAQSRAEAKSSANAAEERRKASVLLPGSPASGRQGRARAAWQMVCGLLRKRVCGIAVSSGRASRRSASLFFKEPKTGLAWIWRGLAWHSSDASASRECASLLFPLLPACGEKSRSQRVRPEVAGPMTGSADEDEGASQRV